MRTDRIQGIIIAEEAKQSRLKALVKHFRWFNKPTHSTRGHLGLTKEEINTLAERLKKNQR